jgi:hypothetical protein
VLLYLENSFALHNHLGGQKLLLGLAKLADDPKDVLREKGEEAFREGQATARPGVHYVR